MEKRLTEVKDENASLSRELSQVRSEVLQKVEKVGDSVAHKAAADKVAALEKSVEKAQEKVAALAKTLDETREAHEATAQALKAAQEDLKQTSKALANAQAELSALEKMYTPAISFAEVQMEFPLTGSRDEIPVAFAKYGGITRKLTPIEKGLMWLQGGKEVDPYKQLEGRYDVLLTFNGNRVVRGDVALKPIDQKE